MNTKEKSYVKKRPELTILFILCPFMPFSSIFPSSTHFQLDPLPHSSSVFFSMLQLPLLVHFLLSISSCHLLCELFQVRTGLWVWTVSTSVMVTSGKIMSHWTCSPMMRELTAGSHFPLQTSKPSHRTKSYRWGNQVMCKV